MSQPSILLPRHLSSGVWRLTSQDEWHTGDIEYPNEFDCDGSNDLLSQLLMSSAEFAEWLGEDFEVEVDEEIVASVFANQPLTDEQLLRLKPDAPLHRLKEAVKERGYPIAAG